MTKNAWRTAIILSVIAAVLWLAVGAWLIHVTVT